MGPKNQWDPNWIKKCRLLILLTYKYPILFCKMVYRFIYLFKKNEITKSFFKIHFLIKLRSHWFGSASSAFRIYLRLEYPIHYFPAECWSCCREFVFICIEIAFKYIIPYTNVRYFRYDINNNIDIVLKDRSI